MGGQKLWSYLTSERPCPPPPTLPTPTTNASDASDAVKQPLLEAIEAHMEAYQSSLDIQATWLHEGACAKVILFASMEVNISLSLCDLSTSLDLGSPQPQLRGPQRGGSVTLPP